MRVKRLEYYQMSRRKGTHRESYYSSYGHFGSPKGCVLQYPGTVKGFLRESCHAGTYSLRRCRHRETCKGPTTACLSFFEQEVIQGAARLALA